MPIGLELELTKRSMLKEIIYMKWEKSHCASAHIILKCANKLVEIVVAHCKCEWERSYMREIKIALKKTTQLRKQCRKVNIITNNISFKK